MRLEEFYDYKNRLVQQLCSDPDVVRLVTGNSDAAVPNYEMPYTQIFPYEFVPETIEDGKTFICIEVDVSSVPNKTYYIPVIYVWIFTHKSRMRVETDRGGAVLVDVLSAKINDLLNGSRYYGLGTLELDSSEHFKPATDFLGRALIYTACEFNRPKGRIDAPSNRKTQR